MLERIKVMWWNTRVNLGRIRIKFDPAEVMAIQLSTFFRILSERVYVIPDPGDAEEQLKDALWHKFKQQMREDGGPFVSQDEWTERIRSQRANGEFAGMIEGEVVEDE